jgi:AcrR family transcriptional regulator
MADLTRREKEKLSHEADIVVAAESVLKRKGFDGASIDEIAKEARFTRRTVYQYFTTKEDLYYAVVTKDFLKLFSYLESELVRDNTGFEKIRRAGSAFYRYYMDYPDAIRLMNYAGYIKETARSGPGYTKFQEINSTIFLKLAKTIEKGQADGSIRRDLPASEAAFSLAFLLTSFFYELSTNGRSFTEFCKFSEARFVNSTLALIFQAIKN